MPRQEGGDRKRQRTSSSASSSLEVVRALKLLVELGVCVFELAERGVDTTGLVDADIATQVNPQQLPNAISMLVKKAIKKLMQYLILFLLAQINNN